MKRFLTMGVLGLACTGLLSLSACAEEKTEEEEQAEEKAATFEKMLEEVKTVEGFTMDELVITAIPDSDSKQLKQEYQLVGDYLAKALGCKVRYEKVKNYGGAVTSLSSGHCDLAWLGGKTTVDAETNSKKSEGSKIHFIACRDIDYQFKSYFIANKDVVAKYKLETVSGDSPSKGGSLEQLKEHASDLTFTFGSKGSTSGHLMPRWYLNEASMVPEDVFKKRLYRETGSHSATLKAVSEGSVDLGALNYTNWDKASDEVKANAPIVFVAGPYTDYCWVGNENISDADAAILTKVFAEIDGSNDAEKAVLEAFGNAKMFLKPDPEKWKVIRDILEDPAVKEALTK